MRSRSGVSNVACPMRRGLIMMVALSAGVSLAERINHRRRANSRPGAMRKNGGGLAKRAGSRFGRPGKSKGADGNGWGNGGRGKNGACKGRFEIGRLQTRDLSLR